MNINYSYHNHTKRCGHAVIANDEEYIKEAKEIGIKYFGFCDHIPFSNIDYPSTKSRMLYNEFNNYLYSVNNLKNKYKDMYILCGLEVEYDDSILDYLRYMRFQIDYMVLGQHFVYNKSRNNSDYPLLYSNEICKGIKSGLFSLLAHPDIFIRYRDTTNNIEEFDKNTLIASEMICKTAKEYNIPIELSLEYTERIGNNTKVFWKMASKYNNEVLIGLDTHDPSRYKDYYYDLNNTLEFIGDIKLNIIEKDYIIKNRFNYKDSFNIEDYYINKIVNIFNESNQNISELKEIMKSLEYNKYIKSKDEIYDFNNLLKDSDICFKDKFYLLNKNIKALMEIERIYKFRINTISNIEKYIDCKIYTK